MHVVILCVQKNHHDGMAFKLALAMNYFADKDIRSNIVLLLEAEAREGPL